jgi:serine-type D-Ala-D-Ala carboxypeptidase
MLLVEDGRMELDAPVSRYLPAFSGGAKDGVTIRHLLAHTSGLPAGAGLWGTPREALARAIACRSPARRAAGGVLGHRLHRALGGRAGGRGRAALPAAGPPRLRAAADALHHLPARRGLRALRADRAARDGTLLQGRVHDPLAQRLGGIAGHAGLFSTVHDVARFAAMLANGGELDGVRVLQPETIRLFAQRQPGAGTRALGWDTPAAGATGAAGERISRRAFGHTGFTGTSLWIDPDRGTWVVLLSNRTYEPRGANRIQAVRRSVHDLVALATDRAALAE